jgi:hypothetical protein
MRELAEKARERRLSGNHHDNGRLVGFCFDNAYVMYNVLREEGYSPKVACGASERYSGEVLREYDIDELESVSDLAGYVHYWVECDGKVIDIASDIPENLGEIIVLSELPDEYHRLSDSYEYAMDIIQSADHRCDYCGGRFGNCGCPKEHDF